MELDVEETKERPRRSNSRQPPKASFTKAAAIQGGAASASCNFCKQRHIRCDGKSPCGQCVKRNLGCYYGLRAKTGPKPKALSSDLAFSNLMDELRAHRRIADYWKNRYVGITSAMNEKVPAVSMRVNRTPGSDSSDEDPPEPCSLHESYHLAKDYVQGVWSNATSTMVYLNSLDSRGGIAGEYYTEDDGLGESRIRLPKDHPEYERLARAGEIVALDEEPSKYRVMVALDLFETQVAPMVTDYKFKRCIPSALAIWRLKPTDTSFMEAAELLCRFEHAIALMVAFDVMDESRAAWRYKDQVEMLFRIVFLGREMHMMAQYAEKLAHMLFHAHAYYVGDDRPGFCRVLATQLYQIVSTHRPFISTSATHRMCMTMLMYTDNHYDRQTWMNEALECESIGKLDEVWSFTHAFVIFYMFCSLHPGMSFDSPTPSWTSEEIFRLVQMYEFASSKLRAQGSHFTAIGHVFPDILLSFHLFIHGVRAELLLLHGDSEAAFNNASFVIGAASHMGSGTWNAIYGLQCAVEVCCRLKKFDWAQRGLFHLTQHSIRVPLAWTLVKRIERIYGITPSAELSQRLKRLRSRLTALRTQVINSLSNASAPASIMPQIPISDSKFETSSDTTASDKADDPTSPSPSGEPSHSTPIVIASRYSQNADSSVIMEVDDAAAPYSDSGKNSPSPISASKSDIGASLDLDSASQESGDLDYSDDRDLSDSIEDNDDGFNLGLPLTASWQEIVALTPPYAVNPEGVDMKRLLSEGLSPHDLSQRDQLSTSNSISRAVVTGSYSSHLTSSLGLNFLRDETFVAFTGLKPRMGPLASEVDEEDVYALLSLLDNVKDDTANTSKRNSTLREPHLPASPPATVQSSPPDNATLLSAFPHLAAATPTPKNPDSFSKLLDLSQEAANSVPSPAMMVTGPSTEVRSPVRPAVNYPPPIVSLGPQSVLPTSLPPGFPALAPLSYASSSPTQSSGFLSLAPALGALDVPGGLTSPSPAASASALGNQFLLQAPYLVRSYALAGMPPSASLGVTLDPTSVAHLAIASQLAAAAVAAGVPTSSPALTMPQLAHPHHMRPSHLAGYQPLLAGNLASPLATTSNSAFHHNPLLPAHPAHPGVIDPSATAPASMVPLPNDWQMAFHHQVQGNGMPQNQNRH